MRGVHELQLLPVERAEQRQRRRGERRDRRTQIMHGSPQPCAHLSAFQMLGHGRRARISRSSPTAFCSILFCVPILHPTVHTPCPSSLIPQPASHALRPPFHTHTSTSLLQLPIFHPHPPSHILHPPSHTVAAQPVATPTLHIPPPVPYTPHLTLHSSHPHSSGHATYPAEGQLDNVGSVAGDDPVGAR